MLSIAEPSPAALDRLVARQHGQPFSYPDVGATPTSVPNGHRNGRQVVELGRGEAVFERASQGLRTWQAHRRAGVHVHPADAPLEEGVDVVLAVRVAHVWSTVACRLVYVLEEPTRFGFAYGTLPDHVLEGEEAFTVERDDTDLVRFVVSAFFRPRGPIMAAVGPLVFRLDQQLVRRYLRGMQQHVTDPA